MNKKIKTPPPLVLIDYGAGNTRSVEYALRRLGVDCLLTRDPEQIMAAEKVIFPGVGHAEAAMNDLQQYGLDQLIPQLTQPVLGICLGMQLMGQLSEEGNVDTLGIMDFQTKKFEGVERIPHMGWNTMHDRSTELFAEFKDTDRVYFVHSYYVPANAYSIAKCHYITDFSAAVRHKNFTGCQFHPEKSSRVGARILKSFLQGQNTAKEASSFRKQST